MKAQQNKKKRKKIDSENFPSLPVDQNVIIPVKINNKEQNLKTDSREDKRESQKLISTENNETQKIKKESKDFNNLENQNQKNIADQKKTQEIDSNNKIKNDEQENFIQDKEKMNQTKNNLTDSKEKEELKTEEEKEKESNLKPLQKEKKSKRKKKQKQVKVKTFREIIKIFKKVELIGPSKRLEEHKNLPVIDLEQDPQIEHITPTRVKEYRRDYKRDHYSKRKEGHYRSRKGYDQKKKRKVTVAKSGEKISLAKGKYPTMK